MERSGEVVEGEGQRDMYKVVTNHGVYELKEQGGEWAMYRVMD